MTRRRSRLLQNRRERRPETSGPDPAAAMRLAGFVAVLLVLVAVAAGFQGDRLAAAAVRALSALGPLAEPVVFGASWLEIGVAVLVLGLIVRAAVRSFRR